MAQMQPYRSRYGDTITDLLARRGDIAAQGALQSGAIWGNAIGNIGQIAAGAVQDYSQMEQQRAAENQARARDIAIAEVFQSEAANDPQQLHKALLRVTDPKSAMAMASGAASLMKMGATKDPKEAMAVLPDVARGFMAAPDALKPGLWGVVRERAIAAGLAKPEEMPEQYDPETAKGYIQFALGMESPEKAQAGFELSPGQTRFDAAGNPIASLPPLPEKPAVDVEGRMIRAEERREQRAIETEQRKAEAAAARAAETAKAAAKETNTQVKSAFAAIDEALRGVEKYAGLKAVTSPLEAANARQQYEDAVKAFAATLSRATGDSRISDLDRKAYADLLAYSGFGSDLLNITRPDLARQRFEKARKFFSEAAKARSGETPEPSANVGGTYNPPPDAGAR